MAHTSARRQFKKNAGRCLSESFKRTPKWCQDLDLWVLLQFFSLLRSTTILKQHINLHFHNSNICDRDDRKWVKYLLTYFLQLNTLKDLAKAPAVTHLRLNLLRDTKTALLTHESYDNHPRLPSWTLLMVSSRMWTPTENSPLVMVPISASNHYTVKALHNGHLGDREVALSYGKVEVTVYLFFGVQQIY